MSTETKDALTTLGQYKIVSSQTAPALAGSRAATFAVQNTAAAAGLTAAAGNMLVGFVGDRTSFFRTNVADRYRSITSPYLMKLLEWGVVEWPDGRQRVAMIMQRPEGVSLQEVLISKRKPFVENEIFSHILPPLVKVLREMADYQLVHGAIDISNVYLSAGGVVTLGECLSSPTSYNQDASVLTIERAIASPIGRGEGTAADDVYALGVLLMTLITGVNPLAGLDPDAVAIQKIEKGSVAIFVGRHVLSTGLMELSRGLLDDDPRQRWSLETLEQWLTGRRLISNQVHASRQTARPLLIGSVEYWDPRSIAIAFSRNVPEAMRLIGNDELIKWVKRTWRDGKLAERIADAVNMPMLNGKLGSYESRLVARVVMALHPAAPIRYQGHALMPDAIGLTLAKAMLSGENPQSIAEIIVSQLPLYWFNNQPDFKEDHVGPIKTFEQARHVLDQPVIGGGIERCLYELSANTIYAGEGFEKFCILDPKQFLLALETLSAQPQKPGQPITRHAAAFLATRDSQLGNRALNRLIKAANEAEKALGNLEILSAVQKHQEIAKLPNLCLWFDTLLQPAIDRLHNRQSREAMRQELHKAAGTGSLAIMLALIENPVIYQRDREGLFAARNEYHSLAAELSSLKQELLPTSRLHRTVGREAAAVVAGMLSVVLATAMIVLRVGQNG